MKNYVTRESIKTINKRVSLSPLIRRQAPSDHNENIPDLRGGRTYLCTTRTFLRVSIQSRAGRWHAHIAGRWVGALSVVSTGWLNYFAGSLRLISLSAASRSSNTCDLPSNYIHASATTRQPGCRIEKPGGRGTGAVTRHISSRLVICSELLMARINTEHSRYRALDIWYCSFTDLWLFADLYLLYYFVATATLISTIE